MSLGCCALSGAFGDCACGFQRSSGSFSLAASPFRLMRRRKRLTGSAFPSRRIASGFARQQSGQTFSCSTRLRSSSASIRCASSSFSDTGSALPSSWAKTGTLRHSCRVCRNHLLIAFPSTPCYHSSMKAKHRKTLAAVFAEPVNGNIEWEKIETLFIAIGCRAVEGAGSSVTFERDGIRAYFHRPHPAKAALRYRVKDARDFLAKLGEKP